MGLLASCAYINKYNESFFNKVIKVASTLITVADINSRQRGRKAQTPSIRCLPYSTRMSEPCARRRTRKSSFGGGLLGPVSARNAFRERGRNFKGEEIPRPYCKKR